MLELKVCLAALLRLFLMPEFEDSGRSLRGVNLKIPNILVADSLRG